VDFYQFMDLKPEKKSYTANTCNIAMLSYHTCPLATLGGKDTGGMNVYVRELTRQLGRMGWHVDVFTRSQDEHVPHVLHDLGYCNRVVHIPAGPESPLPKQELVKYIPEFVSGIRSFAQTKGFRYNLIHSHYWMSGLAAEELSVEWKAPIVHMFHTLGIMKNRVARGPEEVEGSYREEGERKVIKAADRIIAATQAEVSQLHFLYHANSRKLVVIPPGVDTSHFYPIPADEARLAIDAPCSHKMLLFVGRIEPLKGVETLIRAVALMQKMGVLKQNPVCLAIIGGDPETADQPGSQQTEMNRLKSLCQEVGVGDMVIFLGKRSQDSLPYYYSAAEVVVVPSHYESFGMVALEAMACGTPVVASQVGGLAFLVQDGVTGYHVPDDDPEILAKYLSMLITDSELRRVLGKQASEHAKAYAWENIAERVIKVYKKLL
jgi:D-inositol-3-phosphate glycosyltransferase